LVVASWTITQSSTAFSLCQFRTAEFYETVREVREIAFARASKLPPDVQLTLTSAYADTSFGRENWAAIRALASARSSLLCNIVLDCSLDETSDGSNHRNALNYGSSLSQKCLLQRAKLLNRWRPEVITAFD
jgi:hypothetical protein